MNLVLRGLEDRGLVTRPATASHGRELPTELTRAGRELLETASAAVLEVQTTMCTGLTAARQRALLDTLAVCIHNLSTDA